MTLCLFLYFLLQYGVLIAGRYVFLTHLFAFGVGAPPVHSRLERSVTARSMAATKALGLGSSKKLSDSSQDSAGQSLASTTSKGSAKRPQSGKTLKMGSSFSERLAMVESPSPASSQGGSSSRSLAAMTSKNSSKKRKPSAAAASFKRVVQAVKEQNAAMKRRAEKGSGSDLGSDVSFDLGSGVGVATSGKTNSGAPEAGTVAWGTPGSVLDQGLDQGLEQSPEKGQEKGPDKGVPVAAPIRKRRSLKEAVSNVKQSMASQALSKGKSPPRVSDTGAAASRRRSGPGAAPRRPSSPTPFVIPHLLGGASDASAGEATGSEGGTPRTRRTSRATSPAEEPLPGATGHRRRVSIVPESVFGRSGTRPARPGLQSFENCLPSLAVEDLAGFEEGSEGPPEGAVGLEREQSVASQLSSQRSMKEIPWLKSEDGGHRASFMSSPRNLLRTESTFGSGLIGGKVQVSERPARRASQSAGTAKRLSR